MPSWLRTKRVLNMSAVIIMFGQIGHKLGEIK
jgi:hypothetical protein